MLVDDAITARPGMSEASGSAVRQAVDKDLKQLADTIELEELTRHLPKETEGVPVKRSDALRATWGLTAAQPDGAAP